MHLHGLQACLFKYIIVAAFGIYLREVKMLLKVDAHRGGHALKSHGNYIVDHGKSWKNNHEIVFFEFLWEPCILYYISGIRKCRFTYNEISTPSWS